MALLAALLLVVPSAAHADPTEIIRDCADDGALQGDYTAAELRNARNNLPTDIDEYSDCRDVLARALASKTANSGNGGGNGGGGNGGSQSQGGSIGGGDSGTTPQTTSPDEPSSSVAVDPGVETGPTTDEEWKALWSAQSRADRVAVNGRDVSPLLTADVGRNGLPATLVVALALLAAAVLTALLLPLLRRRAGRHRP